ncbi:uncharacterized protein LOC110836496 [Zootermopsis nevadensis]|uniref:Uncharacterized protein n=1 Tax=Zootermopsis nevadensis TaxID=136037 RepID=A0A067RHY5_ZOONE|nr:uncharacterized protein LOC110836496 [Zootermopsis nevadensis]KDR23476.1 hypothetical protein L798_08678 [Zootermopsis nevadensis]
MFLPKHLTYHCSAVLFLLLLTSALSAPYYDLEYEDGGILNSPDRTLWEESDNFMAVKRSTEPFISMHWSGDSRKSYMPYHPVVRFRSPKPQFDHPSLTYTRRFEDRLKKNLSAGEILALLSTIMVDRASKGRLKGLRFGISKR